MQIPDTFRVESPGQLAAVLDAADTVLDETLAYSVVDNREELADIRRALAAARAYLDGAFGAVAAHGR